MPQRTANRGRLTIAQSKPDQDGVLACRSASPEDSTRDRPGTRLARLGRADRRPTERPAVLPREPPQHSAGYLLPLSADAVDTIVQRRAELAGLGDRPISGHSMRAGHATVASEAGLSAERIMRTTRHRRIEALAIYTRPAEVLREASSTALGL